MKPKPDKEQLAMICRLWEWYMRHSYNMRQTQLHDHHTACAYESQFDVDTRILMAEEEYPQSGETGMFALLIDDSLYISYWKDIDLYRCELQKRRNPERQKEADMWLEYLYADEDKKRELDPVMSQLLHNHPGRYEIYSFDKAIDRDHPRGIAIRIDGHLCLPKQLPTWIYHENIDDYCRRKLESRSKQKPGEEQIIQIAKNWLEYILADTYLSQHEMFEKAFDSDCQFNIDTRWIYDRKRNDWNEGPVAVEVEGRLFKAPYESRFRDAFPPLSESFQRAMRLDAILTNEAARERMERYEFPGDEEKREIDKSDDIVRPECPCCGSENVSWIERGNIGIIGKVIGKAARREVTLEPGLISEDDMRWECNECHARYGNTGFKGLIMRAKGQPVPDHIAAQFFTFNNTMAIRRSKTCGCTNCMKIFKPDQIRKQVRDIPGRGGPLCPYCGRDSILGDFMNFPITEEFLSGVHAYWKDKQVSGENTETMRRISAISNDR